MEVLHKQYLDKGKRGVVYSGLYNGEHVLVKEHNPTSVVNTLSNESFMLQKLNTVGVGPRFIAFDGKQLIREYVAGERIETFLQHATISEAKSLIRECLLQCQAMDIAGINKYEMTHPYKHILVTLQKKKVKVVMIDFERCKETEKPKNVTQFCQYVARIAPLLETTGMSLDGEQVKELAMIYKQSGFATTAFKKLLSLFK
jgi:predicted Ser/Thr protein kinase